MRTAIDRFKDAVDQGLIPSTELTPGSEGYPATLQNAGGRRVGRRRRLGPQAEVPAAGAHRSDDGQGRVGDARVPGPADSSSWGGQNVFDVYSKSEGEGLDGTKYRDW